MGCRLLWNVTAVKAKLPGFNRDTHHSSSLHHPRQYSSVVRIQPLLDVPVELGHPTHHGLRHNPVAIRLEPNISKQYFLVQANGKLENIPVRHSCLGHTVFPPDIPNPSRSEQFVRLVLCPRCNAPQL